MAEKKVKVKFIKSPSRSPFLMSNAVGSVSFEDIKLVEHLEEAGIVERVATPKRTKKKTSESKK